jgi:hypothetical protein
MPSLQAPNGEPLTLDPPESLLEAAEARAQEPPAPIECIAAFIIYQLPSGQWQAADDLNAPLVPARKPAPDDFYAGCSVILRDATVAASANLIVPNTAQQAAQAIVNAQMEMGQRMLQARENKAVQDQIERDQRQRAGR